MTVLPVSGQRRAVSVVIPVYGRPEKLSRAIRSVQAQRDVELEIIVVDDHSPDPVTIGEGLADGVRVLRLGQNLGAGPARNFGAAHASHDLLAFLDADDEWLPGSLSMRLPLLGAGRCVVGDCLWINEQTGATGLIRVEGDVASWLPYGNRIHPSTLLLNAADFARAGGFPSDRDCAEDWVFGVRALRAGIHFVPTGTTLMLGHRGTDNTTSDHDVMVAHALGALRVMHLEKLGTPRELACASRVVHARVAGFYANAGRIQSTAAHAAQAVSTGLDRRMIRELAHVPAQGARGIVRRARDAGWRGLRRDRQGSTREG